MLPAKDTDLFRKPFPATLSTPPQESGVPLAVSTPLPKSPVQGLWDEAKKTGPVDLTGEEDDEDISILSSKGSTSLQGMESGGGSKLKSTPAKKALVGDSGS